MQAFAPPAPAIPTELLSRLEKHIPALADLPSKGLSRAAALDHREQQQRSEKAVCEICCDKPRKTKSPCPCGSSNFTPPSRQTSFKLVLQTGFKGFKVFLRTW